jgi:hypothetical protein
MPPDYLHRLLATWRPDTGLVSSPAIGCTPGNMWAELECAFVTQKRMFGSSYSGAAANIPAINKMNPRANERSSG